MQNFQNESKNQTLDSENRATPTTSPELTNKSEISIISSNCTICMSGLLNEIHALRPTNTLREISELIEKEYGQKLSKDALSRHFMHYTKALAGESTKMLLAKFDMQVENVSEHQRKTLFLAKISFDHIVERLEAGTLNLGIDDFEKMIKLYYAVLRDPDSASDDNMMAIFQRASNDFGCKLEQGILIKRAPKAEI